MDLAKNNSEFDVVAMRTDSSVLERKGTSQGNYPARTGNDRNPHAPTYEDLHPQRTRHCEERARVAAWELHTIINKSDGDA